MVGVEFAPVSQEQIGFVLLTWVRSMYDARPDLEAVLTKGGFVDLWRRPCADQLAGKRAWVATIGETVIGFAIGGSHNTLWWVYVTSDYRCKGIGEALMRHVVSVDLPVRCACITPKFDRWTKAPKAWRWRPEAWR